MMVKDVRAVRYRGLPARVAVCAHHRRQRPWPIQCIMCRPWCRRCKDLCVNVVNHSRMSRHYGLHRLETVTFMELPVTCSVGLRLRVAFLGAFTLSFACRADYPAVGEDAYRRVWPHPVSVCNVRIAYPWMSTALVVAKRPADHRHPLIAGVVVDAGTGAPVARTRRRTLFSARQNGKCLAHADSPSMSPCVSFRWRCIFWQVSLRPT